MARFPALLLGGAKAYMIVLLEMVRRKERCFMPQVQSLLAYRLASLINGVVSTGDTLPTENSFDTLDASQDRDENDLLVATPSAPLTTIDELVDVHADAYAAGWTMPLLYDVATQLLEQSNKDALQHPGVAPKRMRAVLPDHLKVQHLRVLHWFDAAHVLAPSVTTTDPFRHPRPIICDTVADLVARLLATPYPSVEDRVVSGTTCAYVIEVSDHTIHTRNTSATTAAHRGQRSLK